ALTPARLKEETATATRGGQTIGENAAGASGADDDIVEGLRLRLHRRVASRALSFGIPRAKSQSIEPRHRTLPVNLAEINGFPPAGQFIRNFVDPGPSFETRPT